MSIPRQIHYSGSRQRIEEKLGALTAGSANQTNLLDRKFDEWIGINNQSEQLNCRSLHAWHRPSEMAADGSGDGDPGFPGV